jgi:hypothetical protein
MESQETVAILVLLIFGCIAFGYWLRGSENASIRADHDDTEHGVGRPL